MDWKITPLGNGSFKMSPFSEGSSEGGGRVLIAFILLVEGLACINMDSEWAGIWIVLYASLVFPLCLRFPWVGVLGIIGEFIYLVNR